MVFFSHPERSEGSSHFLVLQDITGLTLCVRGFGSEIGLQATCVIRLALVSSGQAPQNDVKRQMQLIMNRL